MAGIYAGRIVGALFVLWPTQFFLTPVLASEHLALALCAGYLLVLIRACGSERRNSPPLHGGIETSKHSNEVIWIMLAGTLLAAALAVRPSLIAAAVAGATWLLLQQASISKRIRSVVVLTLTTVAAFGAYHGALRLSVGQSPPSLAWWSLLAGTNFESKGMWNHEDANAFKAYQSLRERNQYARHEVLRRVRTQWPDFPRLALRKLKAVWTDNTFGVGWATMSLSSGSKAEKIQAVAPWLHLASQSYFVVLVLGALFGLIRTRSQPPWANIRLIIGLILFGAAVHLVFETQPRYQYVFDMSLLVLAAAGLARTHNAGRSTPHVIVEPL